MSITTLLWLLSTAHADDLDYPGELGAAKSAMIAKDWATASADLDAAAKLEPSAKTLISNTDVGRLDFYRGVIAYRKSGKIDDAMEDWRKVLILSPDFQPDKDVLPESDAQDVFYALAEEQRSNGQVALSLPDDPGDVLIFVDGRRYEAMDNIYLGTHLIQLRCGDGNLVTTWYTFGSPPPDWLAPCNGGAYPSAAPVKGAKPPKSKPAPQASTPKPEPKPKPEPATPKPAPEATPDAQANAAKPPEATTPKPAHSGGNGAGWALLGTGAALLLGGTATNFLMVNPAYDQIQSANDKPGSVSQDQADGMEGRFHTGAYLTMGLFALGGAAAASGVVVTVVDWHVGFTPGGVWLSGHF